MCKVSYDYLFALTLHLFVCGGLCWRCESRCAAVSLYVRVYECHARARWGGAGDVHVVVCSGAPQQGSVLW